MENNMGENIRINVKCPQIEMANLMTHKPLQTEFKSRGFNFKQLARDGDSAVFSKTKDGWSHEAYEVIKVGRHNGYVLGGVTIEPAETYPSSEQFGQFGFSYQSKERAFEKFKN